MSLSKQHATVAAISGANCCLLLPASVLLCMSYPFTACCFWCTASRSPSAAGTSCQSVWRPTLLTRDLPLSSPGMVSRVQCGAAALCMGSARYGAKLTLCLLSHGGWTNYWVHGRMSSHGSCDAEPAVHSKGVLQTLLALSAVSDLLVGMLCFVVHAARMAAVFVRCFQKALPRSTGHHGMFYCELAFTVRAFATGYLRRGVGLLAIAAVAQQGCVCSSFESWAVGVSGQARLPCSIAGLALSACI